MNWDKAVNRDREVSFQGRLDKVLEKQKRSLRDNVIKNAGVPEDVLVIKRKTDSNGDLISKVIEDQKVINCIFPVLKKIPIRKVTKEFEKGYKITSLVAAHGTGSEKGQNPSNEQTVLDLVVPFDADINVGDTIVRVFVQDDSATNAIMVFEVIDLLSDFSNNAPLSITAKIALTTDPVDLNKPSYQMIIALAKRRLSAGY